MIGLVEADPASRNDMFIRAPKNAAMPTNAPTSNPIPTNNSPKAMAYEKNCSIPLSIRNWRVVRYHS